jgi:hypothetical protein
MALSVVVAVRVTATPEEGTALVAATRDLPAGAVLQDDDLTDVVVAGLDGGSYLLAVAEGVGRQLAQPVAAGQVIPAAALESPAAARLVAVPIDLDRLSGLVQRGASVDVWATQREGGAAALVLSGALVDEVTVDSDWGGATGTAVLRVSPAEVSALVSASRGGDIDLVPVTDLGPGEAP